MGVYIKGMEMPTRCEDCFCYRHNAEYDHAYCNISSVNVLGHGNARLNNCPLVLVPPHGRLIEEADAIETAWMILRGPGYRKEENPQLEQTVREVFATAPAIEVE